MAMDVGYVRSGSWKEEAWDESCGCEVDIDAVGNVIERYKCNGWGHAARICPSKGKVRLKLLASTFPAFPGLLLEISQNAHDRKGTIAPPRFAVADTIEGTCRLPFNLLL